MRHLLLVLMGSLLSFSTLALGNDYVCKYDLKGPQGKLQGEIKVPISSALSQLTPTVVGNIGDRAPLGIIVHGPILNNEWLHNHLLLVYVWDEFSWTSIVDSGLQNRGLVSYLNKGEEVEASVTCSLPGTEPLIASKQLACDVEYWEKSKPVHKDFSVNLASGPFAFAVTKFDGRDVSLMFDDGDAYGWQGAVVKLIDNSNADAVLSVIGLENDGFAGTNFYMQYKIPNMSSLCRSL